MACSRCRTCLGPVSERFRDGLGLSSGFRGRLSQPRRIQSRELCRPSHTSDITAMEPAPRRNEMASEEHSGQLEQWTSIMGPDSFCVETANDDNFRLSYYGHHGLWSIPGPGPGESSERNAIQAWQSVIGGCYLPDHWDCLVLVQHRAYQPDHVQQRRDRLRSCRAELANGLPSPLRPDWGGIQHPPILGVSIPRPPPWTGHLQHLRHSTLTW